jgi:RimJ/RimL family protein N-acetyltransferase
MELRPAGPDDAAPLAALLTHPSAAAYLRARTDAEAELRAELAAADRATGERLLILDGDEVAGTLTWRLVNRRSRIAELSEVVVAPQARGRGLAVAAVRELCRRLFDDAGVHRIQLETFGDNEAARRAFLRAGFVQEGVRRRAYWRREAWQDGVLYGLLSDEA